MYIKHNKKLLRNSQALRRVMTQEERKLWYEFLCRLPVRFRRQKVIGNYIVDFFCDSKKIVVELDGSQHYDEENIRKDQARDRYMSDLGICVLRYSNYDVNMNFKRVCEDVWNHIQ